MTEVLPADRTTGLPAAPRDDHPAPRPSRRVRTVDFRRPTKFNADHERRFKRAHDTFCQTTATRLATELRVGVDLEVINIAQLTWSRAHGTLPQSAVCAVLEAHPIGTPLLLGAELPFVLFAIERLLGGPVDTAPPPRRLTEIDWVLARRTFQTLAEQLTGVWQELAGFELRVGSVDTQPGSAQLALVSEPTLALTVEVRIEQASSTLTILVPYGSIEPVAARIGGEGNAQIGPDAQSAAAIRGAVGAVDIELCAEVGAVDMPIERVLSLRPGDVVELGGSLRDGVELRAGDVAVGRCRPGRSGMRRAVQLLEAPSRP